MRFILNDRRRCIHLLHLFVIVVIAGCSSPHKLANTPHVYAAGNTFPADAIAPVHASTSPSLFYVTDRQPSQTEADYASERSPSMAFGMATVSYGDDLLWEELIRVSGSYDRSQDVLLTVRNVTELVRFPETPLPFEVASGGRIELLPAPQSAYANAIRSTHEVLARRLEESKARDVILYVHGFNTDFHESVLNLADIWHFTGRHGVPIIFSWPAANDGLFAYFKDRESGEFSIYHLKETIRILASVPTLRSIHLVAHSRGADITTTALRELVIEARAAGKNPYDTLKIENLIMAAPDLDFGVVRQRLIAEKFGPAFGQISVYTNPDDGALRLSQSLMAGLRFGRLSSDDMSDIDKKIFKRVKNVNFINVEGINSYLGHGHYRSHPGVLSDIAITIRDRLRPGDPRRPLRHEQVNFWTLPESYPVQNAADEG